MKKVLISFILPVLFCLLNHARAQDSGLNWGNINSSANHLEGKLRGEEFNITIESSFYHFLFNNFYPGKVTLIDNKVIENVNIRYQAYLDELVLFNPKMRAQFCMIDKNTIKEFTIKVTSDDGKIEKHKFIKLTGLYPGVKKQKYLEELYDGSKMLLAHHRIVKEHVHDYINELGMNMEAKYRLKTKYYIYSGNDSYLEIKPKKRLFIRFFENNKQQVRKLIRKNKIKFRKKGEMTRAVKVIDSAGLL